MKKIVFLITIITLSLMVNTSIAQSLFVPKSFSTTMDEDAYSVEELPNKEFVFAGRQNRYIASVSGDVFLFVTDHFGNILRSKSVLSGNALLAHYANAVYYDSTANTISVFGASFSNTKMVAQNNFVLVLDTNLNVLKSKTYRFRTGTLNMQTNKFVRIGTSVFGFITYLNDSGKTSVVEMTSKLIHFNLQGDTLKTMLVDSTFYNSIKFTYTILTDISKSVDNKHLLMTSALTFSDTALAVIYPYGSAYLLKVDTSFSFVDTISITYLGTTSAPMDYEMDVNREVLAVSEKNVVLGPFIKNKTISISGYTGFGICKYNTNTREVVSTIVNPWDMAKIYTPINAQNRSMCFRYDKIFSIGTSGGAPFDTKPNYFAVSCYDTLVNIKWHHYFGGDAYYNASNIYACKDGGVMVMAVRYDFNPDYQRDYYIFKLDSATGYPLSISNISEQLRSGISLYPNPAQDIIQFRGVAIGSQVVLYNMLGQALLSQNLQNVGQSISVAQLPAGTYSYSVTSPEGQKLSSGTWIKR